MDWPTDVLVSVFRFLPLPELSACCRVRRKWRAGGLQPELWEPHHRQSWSPWAQPVSWDSSNHCKAFWRKVHLRHRHACTEPRLVSASTRDTLNSVCWLGPSLLATGGADKTAELWEVPQSRSQSSKLVSLGGLGPFRGSVLTVEPFGPPHSEAPACRMIIGTAERELRVVDVGQGGKCVMKARCTKAVCHAVAHPTWPSTVVSASQDGTVAVWDVRTGAVARSRQDHTCGVKRIGFRRDLIVSASEDGFVRCWDGAVGGLSFAAVRYGAAIYAMACDENTLVVGGNGNLLAYDWSSGHTTHLPSRPGVISRVLCLAAVPTFGVWFNAQDSGAGYLPFTNRYPPVFGPDDATLGAFSARYVQLNADVASRPQSGRAARLPAFVTAVAVSPDLGRVAATRSDGLVALWSFDADMAAPMQCTD